jgi:preprotein translocase subunit SecD
MKRLTYHLLISLVVTILAIWVVATKPVNYGLDLKGGIEIILQPDLSQALKQNYEKYAASIVAFLQKKHIAVLNYQVTDKGIEIELLTPVKETLLKKVLDEEFGNIFQVKVLGKEKILIQFSENYVQQLKETIIQKTIEVLRKRVDSLGVAQAVVTRLGDKYIYVELPGVLDVEKAKKVLGKTARLEFLLVLDISKNKHQLEEEAKNIKNSKVLRGANGYWYLVKYPPVITGGDLQDVYPTKDEYGRPAVGFTLTNEAAEKFAQFTGTHIGKPMAIVLDNRVLSAPVIQAQIYNKGIITGDFTFEEVKEMVVLLKGGSLPVDLKIVEVRVIGPTLGKQAIKQGIMAFVGAIILLFLILIWRYKTAGITASLAVLHNALLLWAGLALLGATLTLPGIAGIILNMGIAVDSNVLIFERVKEELRKGAPLLRSIDIGYKRALSAIIDSHITLLVAALILSQFDAGPVKGFAVTLAIGTLASFFSNVYMSKILLEFIARKGLVKF